jgi:hypothetical protein
LFDTYLLLWTHPNIIAGSVRCLIMQEISKWNSVLPLSSVFG